MGQHWERNGKETRPGGWTRPGGEEGWKRVHVGRLVPDLAEPDLVGDALAKLGVACTFERARGSSEHVSVAWAGLEVERCAGRTCALEHALDGAADERALARNDELVSLCADELCAATAPNRNARGEAKARGEAAGAVVCCRVISSSYLDRLGFRCRRGRHGLREHSACVREGGGRGGREEREEREEEGEGGEGGVTAERWRWRGADGDSGVRPVNGDGKKEREGGEE